MKIVPNGRKLGLNMWFMNQPFRSITKNTAGGEIERLGRPLVVINGGYPKQKSFPALRKSSRAKSDSAHVGEVSNSVIRTCELVLKLRNTGIYHKDGTRTHPRSPQNIGVPPLL